MTVQPLFHQFLTDAATILAAHADVVIAMVLALVGIDASKVARGKDSFLATLGHPLRWIARRVGQRWGLDRWPFSPTRGEIETMHRHELGGLQADVEYLRTHEYKQAREIARLETALIEANGKLTAAHARIDELDKPRRTRTEALSILADEMKAQGQRLDELVRTGQTKPILKTPTQSDLDRFAELQALARQANETVERFRLDRGIAESEETPVPDPVPPAVEKVDGAV